MPTPSAPPTTTTTTSNGRSPVPSPLPLEPHPDTSRRDGPLLVIAAVAVVALLASMVAVGFGLRAVDEAKDGVATTPDSATTSSAPLTAKVTLTEMAIEPATLEVAPGGTLEVTNGGSVVHNLAVEGEDLRTEMLDSHGTGQLDVSGLAPGAYTLYCEVAGHREAGMHATLTVAKATSTAANVSSGAPATHGSGAAAELSADEMDELMSRATKAFPASTEGKGAQLLAPTVLADGTKQFEVTTSIVQWEVEPGRKVEAWAYNGTVPGPTIKVEPGDKVKVILRNDLPESTVIHFHGIDLPNALDGVPDITQPPVKPGASYTYEFTAQSTPAVAMYHSHHNAAKQVANGLAGAFLVGSLPVPAGVEVEQEYVMMLNDAGNIGYSLNGKSFPATEPLAAAQGEWILVHYMNEGVMSHPMHLHGLAQSVIAKDGFPLAQPSKEDTVMVGPGERFSVLVQASAIGTWAWHCHILPHAEREDGMFGMVTALIVT